MGSINLGFSIVSTAYQAFTEAQAVLGNNIANANTPGYSVETPVLTEKNSVYFNGLQFGTGVDMSSVARSNSQFLETQLNTQEMSLGYNQVLSSIYNQLQVIFPDSVSTTTTGLSAQISKFFSDFSALAASPASAALRTNLVSDANSMASLFQESASQLTALMANTNQNIVSTVSQINGYLNQIANLNTSIVGATSAGQDPNTLLDQRDSVITSLSQLINFNQVNLSDNSISLLINGVPLVQEGQAYNLATESSGSAGIALGVYSTNPAYSQVSWTSAYPQQYNMTGLITGGSLGGYLNARSNIISPAQSQLNQLAYSVIYMVNTYSEAGYTQGATNVAPGVTTNIPFFVVGGNAQSIEVNPVLQANVNLIPAAAIVNSPADGENATLIAGLQNSLLNSYNQSIQAINVGGKIDPTQALNSAVTTATNGIGSNSTNFSVPPAVSGTLSVNGIAIPWLNTQSLNTIISNINAALGGQGSAVFNVSTQEITFTGPQQMVVTDSVGNLSSAFRSSVQLFSAANVNIGAGASNERVDKTQPMDSLNTTAINIQGDNDVNFFTSPSVTGKFNVNGFPVNYTDGSTLNTLATNIGAALGSASTTFDTVTQRLIMYSPSSAINLTNNSGNVSQFLNLPGSYTFSTFYTNAMAGIADGTSSVAAAVTNAQASVTQVQNQQKSITQVSVTDQENQVAELANAYEAAVQYANILNQMLNVLINGTAGSTSPAPQNTSTAS